MLKIKIFQSSINIFSEIPKQKLKKYCKTKLAPLLCINN